MIIYDMLKKNLLDYRIIDLQCLPSQNQKFISWLKEHRNTSHGYCPKGFISKEGFEIALEDFNKSFYSVIAFIPFYSIHHQKEGNLPVYAMSLDYHLIVGNILKRIQADFYTHYPNHFIYAQCDIGPLNERLLAISSGLCMRGLNGMAIHKKYGSYGFLATFITDLPLKTNLDSTSWSWCRRCGKCIKACPGKAIQNNGEILLNQCASYLSQEKRRLSNKEKDIIKLSGKIFGCDACQYCCPENQDIILNPIIRFTELLLKDLQLCDINSLSNRQFKKKFGNRAFAWKGKQILERNLILYNEINKNVIS